MVLAILLSPTTYDVNSYHESRILLMQQQNCYFLKSFNNVCEIIYGLGYDLVLHNHLRFGEDRGLGLYSYISYLCILGLLYNYFNIKNSKTYWYFLPAIVFLGLIEPVYQSFSAKNDLPGALGCVASLHLFLKWKKLAKIEFIFMSILAITWAVATKKTYLAIALPIFLFWIKECYKNRNLFKFRTKFILLFGVTIFLTSPALIYMYNIILWGNWSGPITTVEFHKNQSPFIGTIGNLFRYSFEICHLPSFVDGWSSSIFNFSVVEFQNEIWSKYFHPWIGNYGEAVWPFKVQWDQFEDSWFGPFGVLLFLTFLIHLKKPINGNIIYIVLLAGFYFACICNQLSWRPFNDRYFSVFFIICSLLLGWRKTIYTNFTVKYLLIPLAIFLFNWSILFNQNIRTLNFVTFNINELISDIEKNSVLVKTNYGNTKLGYPVIPASILDGMEKNSTISVWLDNYQPIASMSLQLYDFKLLPLKYHLNEKSEIVIESNFPYHKVSNSQYILIMGKNFNLENTDISFSKIWEYNHVNGDTWSLSMINNYSS
jgi:hypothetical protein